MSGEDRPLAGRVVLVTRPAEHSAELTSLLESLGARVEARPTIALQLPGDLEPARAALARLDEYRWIVFTSPSGVRFFHEVAARFRGAVPQLHAAVAAVGPATARALEERGVTVTLVAEDSHGEGLAAVLRGRVGAGQRVLVVAPEVARPVLPDALRAGGALVETVAFYRNAPAPGVAEVARDVQRGRFDVAIFTSPSTAQRLLEAGVGLGLDVKEALRRMAIVAIGDVTARALRQASLPVAAVAARPSDHGVAEAVTRLFRS